MANRVIEIHDSVLKSLSTDSEKVVLDFSAAYIHQSEGRPGIDAGTGWVQRAVLRVNGRIESGTLKELPCVLSDGVLQIDDEKFDNSIPIPIDQEGDIDLHLMSELAEKIHIKGTKVELLLLGEPTYVEEFSGLNNLD